MGPTSADVSVVIPCFRSGATIERAVASVVAQTRPPREVILVDDASGDGSVAALHDLQRRHPGVIRVVELERNGGAGAARNAGWERARGALVAFLDADDSWHRRKLELQASYMAARPDLALTGTGSAVVPDGTSAEAVARRAAPAGYGGGAPTTAPDATPVTPAAALRSNPFFTSSTMVRRDLRLRFPPRRASEDYELWLRIVLGGHGAAVLDPVLAYRHKDAYGDGGLSGRLWQMQRGELEALSRLRRDGLLAPTAYTRAGAWSLAKFVRRLVVAGARRPRR